MVGSSSRGRAVAWAEEMQRVHVRLREAVEVARTAASGAGDGVPQRDLLLYCWGFCQALAGHHSGEDTVLFPAVHVQQPELGPALSRLREDHDAVSRLLQAFSQAVDAASGADELERHLDGIAAIMESHFRYEERVLLDPLRRLASDAPVEEAFGPLGRREPEAGGYRATL